MNPSRTNLRARWRERTEKMKFGDPYDPANDMGTVISEKAAIEIERRVELSLANGSRLLAGHRRQGACYAPTVLDFVTNDSPVVACETFGPVAPIIRFRTLDEAIQIANDTEFGLSGASRKRSLAVHSACDYRARDRNCQCERGPKLSPGVVSIRRH